MFTTKGVSDSGSKYISYGVQEVTITGVGSKEAEGQSSPSVYVDFKELRGDKVLNVRFAFSEKAAKYSLRKLKHLLTKVVTEKEVAEFDNREFTSVTELAKAFDEKLKNKSLRIKFNGKEVAATEGKSNWWKAQLGFPPFAETLATNPSTLTFDKNKDLEALAGSTRPTVRPEATSDLPF